MVAINDGGRLVFRDGHVLGNDGSVGASGGIPYVIHPTQASVRDIHELRGLCYTLVDSNGAARCVFLCGRTCPL